MKECRECKIAKPLQEFSKNHLNHDGLTGACKSCTKKYWKQYEAKNKEKIRAYHKTYNNTPQRKLARKKWNKENKAKVLLSAIKSKLKNKYNLTLEEKAWMMKQQDSKCAICSKVFTSSANAYIDHNHQTNKTRNLLCLHCNSLLGLAKENIEVLQNAIAYLKEHLDTNNTNLTNSLSPH